MPTDVKETAAEPKKLKITLQVYHRCCSQEPRDRQVHGIQEAEQLRDPS